MITGMRKRSGTIIAVIAGLLALGMIVPMLLTGNNPGGAAAGITVAKVGRERITALDLNREFTRLYYDTGAYLSMLPDEYEGLRSQALDSLIEETYILDAAKKANYVADQAAVNAEYEAERTSVGDDQEWLSSLANWGYSAKTYKQDIAKRQIVSAYPAMAHPYEVTDEEVQAEFDKAAVFNTSLDLESARQTLETALKNRKDLEARNAVLEDAKASVTPKIYDAGILAYRAYQEGNYAEAVKQYKRAVKESPQDPYLQMSLAKAYMANSDDKNAKSVLLKADKLAGDDVYYLIAKGDTLGEKGKADEADEAYRRAEALAEKDKDIFALSMIAQGYNTIENTSRVDEVKAKIEAIQEANRQAAAAATATEPTGATDEAGATDATDATGDEVDTGSGN